MCKKEKNTETRPSPQLQNNLRLKVNENNCVKYVNGSEKYIYSDQSLFFCFYFNIIFIKLTVNIVILSNKPNRVARNQHSFMYEVC